MIINNNFKTSPISVLENNRFEENKLNGNNKVDLFDEMMSSVANLNDTQVQSQTQMGMVLTGKSDNTHGALIALEKAELQMSLAVAVRDKLTNAYHTLMNMQI